MWQDLENCGMEKNLMNKEILSKFKKFALITLAVCIVMEIFLFNYKSFVLIGGNYEKTFISMENIQTGGLEYNGSEYVATTNNPTLTFQINKRVKTLRFDIDRADENFQEIVGEMNYSSQGYSQGKRHSDKTVQIVPGDTRTQYITGSYFGDVYEINLTLTSKVGEKFIINGVDVNDKIPFRFSFIRFLFLYVLIILIYIFVKYPALKENYNQNKRSHRYVTFAMITVMLLMQVAIMYMFVGKTDLFTNTSGNQMTQELVDAFEKGQVSLTDEVPQELLELENPYDWSQRMGLSVPYKWDHLLHNGKYYSYYGIGPVITVFLPYHMITGYYFSAPLAVILFNVIGTLFLCLAYLSVIKNWFRKTPCNLTLLGMILIVFGSGMLCNILCPQFYEIAQASGFCFTTVGFYFMVNSGIFQKKTIKKHMLFWSAVFMSLAVLSRAVSALYAMVMVVWIIYGLLQNDKEKGKHVSERIKYLAMAFAPYIVFGLIQMAYNYARFGSPFDFGIQYTLTIYDYSATEISMALVMTSIVNFFMAVPVINTTFPFIHENFDHLNLNGYYFVATKDAMGMIPRVLPLLSLLYTPKVAKQFNKKEKLKYALIWFIPVVIFPIVIVALTWQYGYSLRYVCDFAWEMILGALVLAFFVFRKIKNTCVRKWLYRIMFFSTMWCVICSMAIVFKSVPGTSVYIHPNGANIYYHIRNLIMFWN